MEKEDSTIIKALARSISVLECRKLKSLGTREILNRSGWKQHEDLLVSRQEELLKE